MLFRSAISSRHHSLFSCILSLRERKCEYESLHDASKRVRALVCTDKTMERLAIGGLARLHRVHGLDEQ